MGLRSEGWQPNGKPDNKAVRLFHCGQSQTLGRPGSQTLQPIQNAGQENRGSGRPERPCWPEQQQQQQEILRQGTQHPGVVLHLRRHVIGPNQAPGEAPSRGTSATAQHLFQGEGCDCWRTHGPDACACTRSHTQKGTPPERWTWHVQPPGAAACSSLTHIWATTRARTYIGAHGRRHTRTLAPHKEKVKSKHEQTSHTHNHTSRTARHEQSKKSR